MLGADGHVYAFGDAPDLGSTGGARGRVRRRGATAPATGSSTPPGNVHAFGTAAYRGGRPRCCAGEVVSTISGTPSGNGYWLFTNRGRVFAYGDAHFFGDMSAVQLNGPIVASVATPTGPRLLHGRLRRRRLQLRRRALPRLDGRRAPQPADRRPLARRPTTAATGSSPPTAACSRSARRSAARSAASR